MIPRLFSVIICLGADLEDESELDVLLTDHNAHQESRGRRSQLLQRSGLMARQREIFICSLKNFLWSSASSSEVSSCRRWIVHATFMHNEKFDACTSLQSIFKSGPQSVLRSQQFQDFEATINSHVICCKTELDGETSNSTFSVTGKPGEEAGRVP